MTPEEEISLLKAQIRLLTANRCLCAGPGHNAECVEVMRSALQQAINENHKLRKGECISDEPCEYSWLDMDEQNYCSATCEVRALLNYASNGRNMWMKEAEWHEDKLKEFDATLRSLVADTMLPLETLRSFGNKDNYHSPELFQSIIDATERLRETVAFLEQNKGLRRDPLDDVDDEQP